MEIITSPDLTTDYLLYHFLGKVYCFVSPENKGNRGHWSCFGSHQALLAWDEEAWGDRCFNPEEKKEAKVSSPCWPWGLYTVTHKESVKEAPSACFKYLTVAHLKKKAYSTVWCFQMTWMGATSLLSVKMNISSLSLTHDKVTPVWSRAGPTVFSSHQLSELFGFNSHVQTHLQWHMCTELREQSWDVRRLRRHGCVVYCNFHAQNMPPIINYCKGGCCKTMNELPFEQENIWKVVWFN